MRWVPIALLFAVAVSAGWLMPQPEAVPVAAPPIAEAHAEGELAVVQSDAEPGESGDVSLARLGDGHFYAEGDVDGTKMRFLVDTGASVVALSAADANALGLDWRDEELRMVGRGVNGEVMGKPVVLASVTLGDIEVRDVQAVIIPRGLHVSLLGQSFLSKLENVNISADEMTLG